MARSSTPTPIAVRSALRTLGDEFTIWRKLRRLTVAQVADRAGVTAQTVANLEDGKNVGTETFLRVARALGILDTIVKAADPYNSDVGRLRSDEALPVRVRPKRAK